MDSKQTKKIAWRYNRFEKDYGNTVLWLLFVFSVQLQQVKHNWQEDDYSEV